MKKKIVVALVLIILSMGLFVSSVNAGYVDNVGLVLLEKRLQTKDRQGDPVAHSSDTEVLGPLQRAGYAGDEIRENMKISTTITLTDPQEANRHSYIRYGRLYCEFWRIKE